MSRSGYSDECYDQWELIRWRGAVESAIRGKRGQAFLRELLAALDAMPERRLIARNLVRSDGACCALGCIAQARGVDTSDLSSDPEDDAYQLESTYAIAARLGIANALAQEIVFVNDDLYGAHWSDLARDDDELRWQVVRSWVADAIDGGSA